MVADAVTTSDVGRFDLARVTLSTRNATAAPRLSPFAPAPAPIMSEGVKVGLIVGAIVVGALIITGVIVIHH